MKKLKLSKREYHHTCVECGAKLSDYEIENFGDLCETCYTNLVQ